MVNFLLVFVKSLTVIILNKNFDLFIIIIKKANLHMIYSKKICYLLVKE
jgi:hypothetical protein